MAEYPGFSTDRMESIFSSDSRVAAMVQVESAVAVAQGRAGDIPAAHADAIVTACSKSVDSRVLAEGWAVGTPVLPLLDALRQRLPDDVQPSLHNGLTTQDVVDTATMWLTREALAHLADITADASQSLRTIIARSGSVPTQARSFLQPADVTTMGLRVARWLDQLDRARAAMHALPTPVQLGGLIGDRMGIADDVVEGAADQLGLDPRPPWHTDRTPVIDIVNSACELARWSAKVAIDIAQLVQLGEITARAGASTAAAGKRNPIDAMRAMAAAEVCLGVATVITHAKPHELERGLGSWHAEWYAFPVVLQTAAAALEAVGAALASLHVEPSSLPLSDGRRVAADAFVTSVLEQSP